MSDTDPDDLWPVEPSEAIQDTLADPKLPVELFSAIVALTVEIVENRGCRTAPRATAPATGADSRSLTAAAWSSTSSTPTTTTSYA
ncbi:hypothetical protein [Streptomyces sp. S465]|uniref:hypothetical protein n=1 Tax=Streptomyces sp. S465 TaxID=2979468 RepID=UPI0022A84759|nr:hypothetical protein [Streptomyces sp. S465]WAP53487.1 hypothetical protein N6H00_00110 [Streptomyces sp. S465]